MTISRKMLAVAVAAGFLASGTARAAVYSATITGTITGGTDINNYFGGGNLTGDALTIAYSYDTSLLTFTVPGDGSSYERSGLAHSVSASITINGHTFTSVAAAGNESQAYSVSSGGTPIYLISVNFDGAADEVQFYAPGTGTWNANAIANGPFAFAPGSAGTSLQVGPQPNYDNLSFSTTSTTFGTAAPEPASMTLLGAGLAGLTWLRRRRRNA